MAATLDRPAPEQVIIFCPVCCQKHDTDTSQSEHTCENCGQFWKMLVDSVLVEQYSI